ncbi:hypothetical protein [Bacteroides acidifaciens]
MIFHERSGDGTADTENGGKTADRSEFEKRFHFLLDFEGLA